MSDKRRLFGQIQGGRLNSERLSLRVTARNRIRIDHQQIREEVITLSKIPLLLKEARRQKELMSLSDLSSCQ